MPGCTNRRGRIPETEYKALWGRAAGQCSKPGCGYDCIQRFERAGAIPIGEMAHIIAASPGGPRGTGDAGDNRYENLILLCPTHHTEIDKAPEDFPATVIFGWKRQHEDGIAHALRAPVFTSVEQLFAFASTLLIENGECHRRHGPESLQAQANPLGNGFRVWDARKLDKIIPNNTRIVDAFNRNIGLLNADQMAIFVQFVDHSYAFEMNAVDRLDRDAVPRFPAVFREMVEQI